MLLSAVAAVALLAVPIVSAQQLVTPVYYKNISATISGSIYSYLSSVGDKSKDFTVQTCCNSTSYCGLKQDTIFGPFDITLPEPIICDGSNRSVVLSNIVSNLPSTYTCTIKNNDIPNPQCVTNSPLVADFPVKIDSFDPATYGDTQLQCSVLISDGDCTTSQYFRRKETGYFCTNSTTDSTAIANLAPKAINTIPSLPNTLTCDATQYCINNKVYACSCSVDTGLAKYCAAPVPTTAATAGVSTAIGGGAAGGSSGGSPASCDACGRAFTTGTASAGTSVPTLCAAASALISCAKSNQCTGEVIQSHIDFAQNIITTSKCPASSASSVNRSPLSVLAAAAAALALAGPVL